jgi:hypothetical protein
MVAELNMVEETATQIITKNLNKRNCVKMVPKYLNADQNTGGRGRILERIKGIQTVSAAWSSAIKLLFQYNSEI